MSNRIPAATGWLWFKQGFALYRKQPGLLAMLLLLTFMCFMVLNGFPLIGQIVAALLIPSFNIARMQACYLIEKGQPVSPSVLFTGFRKDSFGPLCKLGVVYLVLFMIFMVILALSISPEFVKQFELARTSKKPPTLATGEVVKMLAIGLTLQLALLLMSFAPALTYWKQMPPLKATFYSVFAIIGSARAFAVLLVSWFGILFIVLQLVSLLFRNTEISLSLSLFALFLFELLRRLAIYASYRQLFPDDAPLKEEAAPD
ncbi:MAG: BPSS1780 family membrane protein [Pseudomonadota bacterium]